MSTSGPGDRTLTGRILGVAGRTDDVGVTVWFAYRTVDGEARTNTVESDDAGEFVFDLPDEPVASARVGADFEGLVHVDLEADGSVLEPGDVILMVDDFAPAHNRYLYG